MKCKLTNKKIKPFMSFGKMPLANGFLNKDEFKSEYFFEMEVGFSEDLALFQLNDHPKPEKMFNKKYPFYTGSSELMKVHFKKYSDWIVEYVNAWKKRTELNRGNIPTNIGLNGKIGGEYGGRWYKGTYGWNFTIFDGEIEKIAHRNTFSAGMWPGFGNAFLLTGNPAYINTLRRQISNLYAQKKLVRGQVMIPQMFGDPRGYQYTCLLYTSDAADE